MKHSFSGEFCNVKLTPLEEKDIEALRILRNKHRNCFVYSGIISENAQKSWYQGYLNKENDFAFSIFYNKEWIGSVSIYNINGKTAEFGRLLIDSEKTHRKGLGTDATMCACQIAFELMNMEKITLQVYEDNIAAYKTYLKAGFEKCGVSYDNGGRTLIDMSITK